VLDDVVQEVFMVVHARLGSYEGRSPLRVWLSGVVRNVARAHLRRRDSRPVGDGLDEGGEGGDALAERASPEDELARKDGERVLRGLLARMTELQREAFWLCDVEGLKAPEAAASLRINENTLRARLRAARKVIREGGAVPVPRKGVPQRRDS
jgi:RNA polymerase sigma-70 factor (ECF subfamily)